MALSWVLQEATHPYPVPPAYPTWRGIEPVRRVTETGAIAAGMPSPAGVAQSRAARRAYREAEEEPLPEHRIRIALDLMTRPVVTLGLDRSTADALEILGRHRFRHLPVVDGEGRLVGILSDRDLPQDSGGAPRPVEEVMTRKVLTGTPGTEIRAIARVLVHERIHSLPILDDLRRPVGILTTTDILRALVHGTPFDLWI